VPKKCTVNAADVAFFLSTRLDNGGMTTKQQHSSSSTTSSSSNNSSGGGEGEMGNVGMDIDGIGDSSTVDGHRSYGGEEAASRLRRYESKVADLASEFEDSMVRF
jgi:hypothetical protein